MNKNQRFFVFVFSPASFVHKAKQVFAVRICHVQIVKRLFFQRSVEAGCGMRWEGSGVWGKEGGAESQTAHTTLDRYTVIERSVCVLDLG